MSLKFDGIDLGTLAFTESSAMPHLIKHYIRHSIIGFGLSAVFVAMILTLNVANLWYLVTHTDVGFLAVFLLWLFNGIVFAGVQFGISIMLMKYDEDEDDDPQGGRPVALAPVPADAPTRRKNMRNLEVR
jgi:hypothetical protein